MNNNEASPDRKPETAAVAVAGVSGIVIPDVERARKAMDAFETIKSTLLESGKDKVEISGKFAITRSGFSKIALAFNLSTEITKISRIATEQDYIVHVIARAWLPDHIRYAEGSASCSRSEFKRGGIEGTIHNIESKAATRATNRAVANLVGGGVLSKEEMEIGEETEPKGQPQAKISEKQVNYAKALHKDAEARKKVAVSLDEFVKNLFGKEYTLETLNRIQATTLIEDLKSYENGARG